MNIIARKEDRTAGQNENLSAIVCIRPLAVVVRRFFKYPNIFCKLIFYYFHSNIFCNIRSNRSNTFIFCNCTYNNSHIYNISKENKKTEATVDLILPLNLFHILFMTFFFFIRAHSLNILPSRKK